MRSSRWGPGCGCLHRTGQVWPRPGGTQQEGKAGFAGGGEALAKPPSGGEEGNTGKINSKQRFFFFSSQRQEIIKNISHSHIHQSNQSPCSLTKCVLAVATRDLCGEERRSTETPGEAPPSDSGSTSAPVPGPPRAVGGHRPEPGGPAFTAGQRLEPPESP